MDRRIARVAAVVVSAVLLAMLYRRLDVSVVAATLLRVDPGWLAVSVLAIVPITVLRAIRFYWVVPAGALPGLGEAIRLTLVASALNVFMPAKSGDLVKSYFISRRSGTPAGVSVAVVIYERVCDLFALTSWCLLGWLLGRPQVNGLPEWFWALLAGVAAVCLGLVVSQRAAEATSAVVAAALRGRRMGRLRELLQGWPLLVRDLRERRRWIVPFSLVLWLSHLVQLWLFTIALSLHVPFAVCASLSAVALMAGQLPFTIAGIGSRDVALVVLLSGYVAPESAAALGVLISTRGFLPPLLGLPIMRPYVTSMLAEARRWRTAASR